MLNELDFHCYCPKKKLWHVWLDNFILLAHFKRIKQKISLNRSTISLLPHRFASSSRYNSYRSRYFCKRNVRSDCINHCVTDNIHSIRASHCYGFRFDIFLVSGTLIFDHLKRINLKLLEKVNAFIPRTDTVQSNCHEPGRRRISTIFVVERHFSYFDLYPTVHTYPVQCLSDMDGIRFRIFDIIGDVPETRQI